MSESLISSFLVSNVSELLRSITKNERCEWITQVAHQKWATMSNSLRLLTNNEWPWANRSDCSKKISKWANRSVFWANRSCSLLLKKMNNSLKKIWKNRILVRFHIFWKFFFKNAHSFWAKWANRSSRSGQMSDRERFAQVAQKEWTIVSESLRSLTKH